MMPTGFGKSVFFSHVLHITAIKRDSVVLVICPLIGLIEDQIKEGQPPCSTCVSLQDVNDLFSENPLPQLLFASSEKRHSIMTSGTTKIDLQRFPNKLN